jgi:hypothetical protein
MNKKFGKEEKGCTFAPPNRIVGQSLKLKGNVH